MRKKSLMFAVAPLLALVFCGFFVRETPLTVHAVDGGETSETTVQETPTKEEPTVAKWVSDTIVPLIGGFSVANVVGIAVSIITAIMKTRGDKNTAKTVNSQNNEIKSMREEIEKLKSENEKYKVFAQEMIDYYKVTLNDSVTTMKGFSKTASEISETLVEQNMRIEDVTKMKNTIEVSCNLTAKMLALSDVAVKSGIAEDAQRLVQTLSNEEVNDDAKEE